MSPEDVSFEGVWTTEMLGPYGWERMGVSFLENGRSMGGGADFFGIGTYTTKDREITIKSTITQYGQKRNLFGGKFKQLAVVIKAVLEGDTLQGTVQSEKKGAEKFKVMYRARRRAQLPPPKS